MARQVQRVSGEGRIDILFEILKWECAILAIILLPVISGMALYGIWKLGNDDGF